MVPRQTKNRRSRHEKVLILSLWQVAGSAASRRNRPCVHHSTSTVQAIQYSILCRPSKKVVPTSSFFSGRNTSKTPTCFCVSLEVDHQQFQNNKIQTIVTIMKSITLSKIILRFLLLVLWFGDRIRATQPLQGNGGLRRGLQSSVS